MFANIIILHPTPTPHSILLVESPLTSTKLQCNGGMVGYSIAGPDWRKLSGHDGPRARGQALGQQLGR